MALNELITGADTTIRDIANYLDGLSHDERMNETMALDRTAQRRLFVKASEATAIDLDHFVPPSVGSLQAVRHHGKNTLPLPGRHKRFAKVFCRPDDGTPRVFGYNDAPSRPLVGPGYFVGVPTAGHDKWFSRGAVVIDYFQVPDGKVVPGWPKVRSNKSGLQRFVYDGTRDYMRRVSKHVSIGAAFKGSEPLDHYFVLCREE